MPTTLLITLALFLTLIPLQGSTTSLFGLAQESDLWNFDTLLLFLVLAFFQIYGLVKGKLLLSTREVRVALLLSAIIIFFSLLPRSFPTQTHEVVRLLLIVWLLPIIGLITDQWDRRHLAILLVSIACLHAIWGISQFVIQENLGLYILGETRIAPTSDGVAKFAVHGDDGTTYKSIRAYGPYAHPNILGAALVMTVLSIILVPLIQKHSLLMPLIFTILIGVILTFSRAAWLSILLAGLFFIWRALATRNLRSIQTICILIAVTLLLFMPLVSDRLQDQDDQAVMERMGGTQTAVAIFREHPFLGVGAGNYVHALAQYYIVTNTAHDPWEIAPVHSIPLLLLTEWGIVGTLVLAAGISLSYLKLMNTPTYGTHAAFIVGILPLLLLDHYFLTQTAPLVWLMMAWFLILGGPEKPLSLSPAPQSIAR